MGHKSKPSHMLKSLNEWKQSAKRSLPQYLWYMVSVNSDTIYTVQYYELHLCNTTVITGRGTDINRSTTGRKRPKRFND